MVELGIAAVKVDSYGLRSENLAINCTVGSLILITCHCQTCCLKMSCTGVLINP